jgi:hypothetical protein
MKPDLKLFWDQIERELLYPGTFCTNLGFGLIIGITSV